MRTCATSEIRAPFAPPYLVDGDLTIGQTASILQNLSPRFALVGESEADRVWTHQIQLTIADAVAEAHDTHHPLTTSRYYEDQRDAALVRAAAFRKERIPKYLEWFERVLACNPGGSVHLVGAAFSYADLSLFQLVEGLRYAFPIAGVRALSRTPAVARLHARVAQQELVRAYLASPKRIAFNEDGIFRRYPELNARFWLQRPRRIRAKLSK